MSTVSIKSAAGTLLKLLLAEDDQGAPQFRSGNQEFLQPSVQVGEPGYANFLPRIGGVYAQNDLSGGVGSKVQVPQTDPDFNRYYYAEWADCSAGYAQKGPAVTTLSVPANSNYMTGSFVLGGTLYLCLTRKIVSWGGVGSDVLTEVKDFGVGAVTGQPAVFYKLGTETSLESSSTITTTAQVQSADQRLSQEFRISTNGIHFLSRVDVTLNRTGTVPGDVRMSVHTDKAGKPSGDVIATSSVLASTVATSAATVSFRFDTDASVPLAGGAADGPYHLVLDVLGSDSTNYINWSKSTSDVYARGESYQSLDRGNSWAAYGHDFVFNIYGRIATSTAFVGMNDGALKMQTTTDGSTYTADSYRISPLVCVVGDRLVRCPQRVSGLIAFSDDGVNWDAPIAIGDVTSQTTQLLDLDGVLIVCKTDSIWAVDPDTGDVIQLQGTNGGSTGANSNNGLGSTVWKGIAYVPFSGRLVAIQGNFDSGFTVYTDISPSVLPGWDNPHGAGAVVAVAGDRRYLYAILSASGGYRLYKASNPLQLVDDKPAPNWHGSIATIGDGTNTLIHAVVFDAGGTNSPELFCTTTSNAIARIRLSRTPDPSADSSFVYDTSTVADVYLPDSTLAFSVHPKAWLFDSLTFAEQPPAGDYVDTLYHRRDAEGWKRTGRLRDTGSLLYPVGLESRLLGRRLRISNSASTASPLVSAVAVTGAVRPIDNEGPREITFTVQSEDGLSAASLGEQLGIIRGTQQRALYNATRGGTRTLIGPRGEIYRSVLFLSTVDVLTRDGDADLIQVQAVQVG